MKIQIAALMLLAMSAVPALAADRSAYDGVYTGRPTGAGCEEVNRDFALVLDGGQAHMVYSVASGSQLTGAVTSRGVVHLTGPNQVTLDGQVTTDAMTGILKTPRGAACQVAYARPAGTVAPATTSVADYDGLYVGRPISLGECPDVNRDFTIVVSDGVARMVMAQREGRQLVGKVRGNGDVEMLSEAVSFHVKLVGRIVGDELTAQSSNDADMCHYSYDFRRAAPQ